MRTKTEIDEIGAVLGAGRGKFFNVKFKKKDGSIREMLAVQGIKQGGSTPLKGGKWANGNTKATDHGLVLVTDVKLDNAGKYSRRSFKIQNVMELKLGNDHLVY